MSTITGTLLYEFVYTGGLVPPPDFTLYVPIKNGDGSFVFDISYTNVSNLVSVTVGFQYTEIGSPFDGLGGFDSFYNTQVSSVTITQFDGIPLSRDGSQFASLKYIHFTAVDAPTILTDTLFNGCFYNCPNFNSPVNHWVTTGVKSAASCFSYAKNFNQPLNNWDMSNVTNMVNIFNHAEKFNQPLNNWNISNNTNLYRAFQFAKEFNQNLSSWDVSKVTIIEEMFGAAVAFNQPLNWADTSSIRDMKFTFVGASSFNQSLSWDITSVTNLEGVFDGASSFNGNLNWNTSNVTTLLNTFRGASSFNQPLNSWDTSSVTDMTNTFRSASSFNQPLNNWNTANVVSMPNMFRNATVFNQDLNDWNMTNVLDFTGFNTGSALSSANLPPFNPFTGSLTYNFTYTGGLDPFPDFSLYIPISNTHGSFATPYNFTFVNTGNFISATFNFSCTLDQITYSTNDDGFTFKDVASFYVNNTIELTITNFALIPFSIAGSQFKGLDYIVLNNSDFMTILPNTSLSRCFEDVTNIDRTIGGPNKFRFWRTENVYDMSYFLAGSTNFAFTNFDEYWNTDNVTNMSHMFADCPNFVTNGLYFSLQNVQDLSYMFSGASQFNFAPYNIDFTTTPWTWSLAPQWHTYAATNMAGMFQNASSFDKNLTGFVTTSVTNMSNMFQGATIYNQPMNEWDMASVTDMSLMFQNAVTFNQPINNWDVSSVTNMNGMLQDATSFNQPLNNWNVSSVTDMSNMFLAATAFDQPLNDWNVASVTNMSGMFNLASAFNQPLNDWNTASVTDVSYMFYNAVSFDQNLSSWNMLNVTDSTNFSTGSAITPSNAPSLPAPFQYSFQYTGGGIAPDFTTYLPIINAGGSFTTLNANYTNVSNLITMTVDYVYSYNNNNDGLTFELVSAFYINNTTNLTIIQFGSIPISKGGGLQFADLTDLTFTATDRPVILSGTTLALCFQGGTNFNSSLSNWVTTNAVNMNGMFFDASSFNQDISGWNTALVTNMTSMFQNATVFNQNLSGWNVALVTQYNNFSTGSALTLENLPNFSSPVVCFKSGSKILCVINGKEQYVVIDNIKPGTHVKTRLHGLKRVLYVGRSVMVNRKSNAEKDKLFKCTKSNYPEVFEDLVITGGHSILVDHLSEEEKEGVIGLLQQVCVTEDKYRLPACLDKRAEKFEEIGIFTIYHIALENENIMNNYGILANGLLVETCSLRFIKELSKMEITGPGAQ